VLVTYTRRQIGLYVFTKNALIVIIKFVIPVVFNKLIRVECMFLSNTTYFIWW